MPASKPKKVGRPMLPKGDAKAVMLRVRVTPDDLKAMEMRAKASKKTVSEWIRRTIMTELHPTKVIAQCEKCNKTVDALVMVPPCDLIAALEHSDPVRAMHTSDEDGDQVCHQWTIIRTAN
jgi:hypothetical protein